VEGMREKRKWNERKSNLMMFGEDDDDDQVKVNCSD
jgi:hypothetical protein